MLAEALKKRYTLTADEAHELECGTRNWKRRIAERDALAKHGESYRRRSNFHTPDPGQAARMASANPEAWSEFLHESDAKLRANELTRGVTYQPPPRSLSTLQAVQEYMAGFGAYGLGSRQVAAAVGRSKRGVDEALAELEEMGEVTLKLTNTRGKSASRRKVYFSTDPRPVCMGSDTDREQSEGDLYFENTPDEHDPGDAGAGGGRVIRPLRGAD